MVMSAAVLASTHHGKPTQSQYEPSLLSECIDDTLMQSSDDFSSDLDSRDDSDGWSSVLESEIDHGMVSRNTRDTRFSNITLAQNLSEYHGSSFDIKESEYNSNRVGRDSSRAYRMTSKANSIYEESDETASVMSFNIDNYRDTNEDGRSRVGSYQSSRYTTDSYM